MSEDATHQSNPDILVEVYEQVEGAEPAKQKKRRKFSGNSSAHRVHGLNRVDGKRPDGVTTVPWKCGKLLVWDATCSDTFAPSYVSQATMAAGEVATHAEERKCSKYSSLSVTHDFIPVAIETSGVMGPQPLHFLRELGRRVGSETGDPLASSHLFQHLSTTIQRGNSACIMGGLRGHD